MLKSRKYQLMPQCILLLTTHAAHVRDVTDSLPYTKISDFQIYDFKKHKKITRLQIDWKDCCKVIIFILSSIDGRLRK